MLKNKRWEINYSDKKNNKEFKTEDIIQILLENRGIKSKEEREKFLNPKLKDVDIKSVGINTKELNKTILRIKKAIEDKEQTIVYGDYDVDGITGTAILWETLYKLKANVLPYIPHRVDEGYGLSEQGIKNLRQKISDIKLIITVDNGIVANDAIAFAKKEGIEVIITDHHTVGENNPDAFAIIHTTKLCGAGVAWLLSKEIKKKINQTDKTKLEDYEDNDYLDLVSLATVADLVPLTDKNRILLKTGLDRLRNTKRLGLLELFEEAGINPQKIGVYEIGHIIGPRLNAMGRLESAMDSLRLLCTKNPAKAKHLAHKLGITNRERQLLTHTQSTHALEKVKTQMSRLKSVLIVSEQVYEEGIIGLIAGKLVEEFYRPAIVIARGEKISKASARSIAGFNIIEFIRTAQEYLINAGGHPMAAGFTIETEKIIRFQEFLEKSAEEKLNEEMFTKILKIDCEIPFSIINQNLYERLQELAPFGMANHIPTFVSRKVAVEQIKILGKEKNHLKLLLTGDSKSFIIEALAFGKAQEFKDIKPGEKIDIVYSIEENEWNGRKKLQLKIRDIKKSI